MKALTLIADNAASIMQACAVSSLLLSAATFFIIGGGWIVAGIGCLAWAGWEARRG